MDEVLGDVCIILLDCCGVVVVEVGYFVCCKENYCIEYEVVIVEVKDIKVIGVKIVCDLVVCVDIFVDGCVVFEKVCFKVIVELCV